jgi:flagellar protein FlaG
VPARPAQAAPAVAEKADLQFDARELRSRVEEAIDRLNEQMAANGRDLRFSIDARLDRTIVTVRSSVSGEIVRQIPDDAMLRVARSIEDLKGVLYNEVV